MACKTILAAAEVRGDGGMLLVLRGVNNDQCAAELQYMYHHNCHASYTSIKSVKTTKPGTSTEYANAFADLTATIVPKLVAGKAYDMTSLLHKYQVLSENQGVEPDNLKAKEIQWRVPDELKNVIVRMGGFHIAPNYLSLLGKMYSDSGLEDLWIESGVYASGTTTKTIQSWSKSA